MAFARKSRASNGEEEMMMIKLLVDGPSDEPQWVSVGSDLTIEVPVTFSMDGQSARLLRKVRVSILEAKEFNLDA